MSAPWVIRELSVSHPWVTYHTISHCQHHHKNNNNNNNTRISYRLSLFSTHILIAIVNVTTTTISMSHTTVHNSSKTSKVVYKLVGLQVTQAPLPQLHRNPTDPYNLGHNHGVEEIKETPTSLIHMVASTYTYTHRILGKVDMSTLYCSIVSLYNQ